jgi:hypothetical protein
LPGMAEAYQAAIDARLDITEQAELHRHANHRPGTTPPLYAHGRRRWPPASRHCRVPDP